MTVLYTLKFIEDAFNAYAGGFVPYKPIKINGETHQIVLTGSIPGSLFDLFYGVGMDKLIGSQLVESAVYPA